MRAAAQLLGVPTATLRSWTRRYGIGPAEHRPGAHRLYSDNDLQTLRHMRTLIDQGVSPRSAARTAMASATPGYAETAPLLAAAFGLDAINAALIIERHLRHYGVLDTWDLLVRPVFAVIEGRQREGEKCIDIEHMLSWAVARSFQKVPMPPTWTPTSVILACTADETHALPLEALRAALCERGCGVLMLGPRSRRGGGRRAGAGLTAEGGGDLVANCRHRGCGHDQDGRQGGTTGDGRGTRVGLRAPATGDGAPKIAS
ncbi:merR HTH regulatory family protein [Mycobacterium xenopi 4042]|uniref:MerR HTH regulatory family protein n=1 Tax=Mycobacterium xenopi 4042 TaxID=1299334 RepID=X8EWS8_MYCXE|nr:merR HTH regulatory family protein [Mycobacterium xenopi 4042]